MKIITGMHRSGTSLIAQLFHVAGANLGNEQTFYPADKWNPDGYFEQPDIHSINFPLINGPFWKFSYFFLPSENTILKRASKISSRINDIGKKYENAVVKETRFCLTLPAWQKHGVSIEKIIVCLREPIEVASSLKKRNWISYRRGLELWKIHNLRLLKSLENYPHVFVKYDQILNSESYMTEAMRCFSFFDLKIDQKKCLQLGTNHVKPMMNNNKFSTYHDYPKDIQNLWEHLLKEHSRQ